ncbi:Methyltransferase domain-containing protein [Cladophialophora immunda]|nr:Methyltransferase domain-containing protein [Cladophialophora immunda]
MEDHKLQVQNGYDKIAQTYLDWISGRPTARLNYVEKLLSQLQSPSEANVLELGCGAGVPGTRFLAQRCGHVFANDISQAQIDLAKTNVPEENVQFIQGDMTKLKFDRSALQAVVAFYSIIHLPRDEQRTLIRQIWEWLSPAGYLLCNLGVADNPGSTADWLGSRMYWSGFDAETSLGILKDAGFTITQSEVLQDDEDGRLVPFLWILAKKS